MKLIDILKTINESEKIISSHKGTEIFDDNQGLRVLSYRPRWRINRNLDYQIYHINTEDALNDVLLQIKKKGYDYDEKEIIEITPFLETPHPKKTFYISLYQNNNFINKFLEVVIEEKKLTYYDLSLNFVDRKKIRNEIK